jgi:precorrin-2 dehydrogenase/sirohydrochlorin ferrochelatase
VVDHQTFGDFHTPSIVDRSPVICAIGTGGAAPVLATLLRASIEARWPKGLGRIAELSEAMRETVKTALPDGPARRAYWRRMLKGPAGDAAVAGDMEDARRLATAALRDDPREEGRVWLLQAPADPDLLTLRALRAMGAADRIVSGEAVAEVVRYARRDAERRTHATPEDLAQWAEAGLAVLHVSTETEEGLFEALRARGARVERLPTA